MGNQSQDRAAMQSAVQQIDAKINSITATQSALQSQIQSLLGSGWQGEAANAFMRAFQSFEESFKKMLDALGEIHTKLQQSLGQYTNTESEQASTATSSIEQALGG